MGNYNTHELFKEYFDLPLKELPSQKFYYNLVASNDELKKEYQECKSVFYIQNKGPNIIRVCDILINYLKSKDEKENEEQLNGHHCNLLSLWIYDLLVNKFKYDFRTVIRIYGKLNFILSKVFNESQAIECLRNVGAIAFDNWKERKDLYDYCVDYDEIIKKVPSSYVECKEYEKYIQEKTRHYKNFEQLYIKEYRDKNPLFYEQCSGYNPESLISALNCEEKFPNKGMLKEDGRDPRLLDYTHTSRQNSDSTDTYGNVLLGVVATSMTSGMIFKFTPLGRRLRNRYGWNNYTAGNLNDGGNMLFAETHDPFSQLSEEREHHIGYLPA